MYLFTTKLQEVKFNERPVVVSDDFQGEEVSFCDVVVTDLEDNHHYCIALLEKLFSLRESEFQKTFIDYQCDQLESPAQWLMSLDELMHLNSNWFYEARREYLCLPFYELIANRLAHYQQLRELKTKANQNDQTDNPYNIEKVKEYLKGIPDLYQQQKMLYRFRTDYLQYKENFSSLEIIPFDEQIKLELAHSKLLIRYGHQPVFDDAKGKDIQKLTVVVTVEFIAIAFKKLFQHKGIYSKPYLNISAYNFILFLSEVLQSEDGRPLNRKVLVKHLLPSKANRIKKMPDLMESQFLSFVSKEKYYEYDLDKIKRVVKSLANYTERLIFLDRVLTNFRQHHKEGKKTTSFVGQIALEIKQQKKERGLQKKLNEKKGMLDTRIKINGNINILMTFFYDLMDTFPKKKKTQVFSNSKKDIIYFVEKYFVQKRGKKVNVGSIRVMLTPYSEEKRCNEDVRINLEECLKYKNKTH